MALDVIFYAILLIGIIGYALFDIIGDYMNFEEFDLYSKSKFLGMCLMVVGSVGGLFGLLF